MIEEELLHVIRRLEELSSYHTLESAHAAEYIEPVKADSSVQAALTAAVHGGISQGLQLAVDALFEVLRS